MTTRRRSKPWRDDVPPEGWPPDSELKVRRFKTKQVRDQEALRASANYLHVTWGELSNALRQINADRATRLWIALVMVRDMDKIGSEEWFRPRPWVLQDLGLDDQNYGTVLARLERQGLVEVQRRAGKRAIVRLIKPTPDVDRPETKRIRRPWRVRSRSAFR